MFKYPLLVLLTAIFSLPSQLSFANNIESISSESSAKDFRKIVKLEVTSSSVSGRALQGQQMEIQIQMHLKNGKILVCDQSYYSVLKWGDFKIEISGAQLLKEDIVESNGKMLVDKNAEEVIITVTADDKAKTSVRQSFEVMKVESLTLSPGIQEGNVVLFSLDAILTDGTELSVEKNTLNVNFFDVVTDVGEVFMNKKENQLFLELPDNMSNLTTSKITLEASIIGQELKNTLSIPINFSQAHEVNYSGLNGRHGDHGRNGGINSNQRQSGSHGRAGTSGTRGKSVKVMVDLVSIDFYEGELLMIKIYSDGGLSKLLYVDPRNEKSKVTIYSSGGYGGSGGRGGAGKALARVSANSPPPTRCGHGGNGGDGGMGGDGGNINLTITNRAKPYKDMIILISRAGSGGTGGFGGDKSREGSYCANNTVKGEHGHDGYPGQSGSVTEEIVENL